MFIQNQDLGNKKNTIKILKEGKKCIKQHQICTFSIREWSNKQYNLVKCTIHPRIISFGAFIE